MASRAQGISNEAINAAASAEKTQQEALLASSKLLKDIDSAKASVRQSGHTARKKMWKAFKAEREAVNLMHQQALVQSKEDLKVSLARAQVYRRRDEMAHIKRVQHLHGSVMAAQ